MQQCLKSFNMDICTSAHKVVEHHTRKGFKLVLRLRYGSPEKKVYAYQWNYYTASCFKGLQPESDSLVVILTSWKPGVSGSLPTGSRGDFNEAEQTGKERERNGNERERRRKIDFSTQSFL